MRASTLKTPRFRRPLLVEKGPDRRAGTLFRSDGAGIGGFTLQDTEAAAIAAVRAGYRVAELQIERMQKLGKRMSSAGERVAGAEPNRQAVDHTEELINKGVLAGLSWVEGLAAEPGSPLHRFVTAQYRMLGGILGINAAPAPVQATSTAPPVPRPGTPARGPRLVIVHAGEVRRRVQLRTYEFSTAMSLVALDDLAFFHECDLEAAPIIGRLVADAKPAQLHIKIQRHSPTGQWAAALCDVAGVQHGWIEFEI